MRPLLKSSFALSLFLLVATVTLLVEGPFRQVELLCRQSPASATVVGVRGRGIFHLSIASPAPGWRAAVPRILNDWTADFAGFQFGPELPPGHWPGAPSFVVVPFWFLSAVFAACAGACWLLLRIRHAAGPDDQRPDRADPGATGPR